MRMFRITFRLCITFRLYYMMSVKDYESHEFK